MQTTRPTINWMERRRGGARRGGVTAAVAVMRTTAHWRWRRGITSRKEKPNSPSLPTSFLAAPEIWSWEEATWGQRPEHRQKVIKIGVRTKFNDDHIQSLSASKILEPLPENTSAQPTAGIWWAKGTGAAICPPWCHKWYPHLGQNSFSPPITAGIVHQ